ncbi:MAG: bacteriophage holin [Proteobacteria bacterium]|nr:bacteriophage holin [Pseudomonadota bacterium]
MEGATPCKCGRLSACALGTSLGVLSGVFILILGLMAHFFQYGSAWVNMASSVYLGFAATPQGIIIGIIWAFVEGFVFGYLLAWIYNFVAKKCPCKHCRSVHQ